MLYWTSLPYLLIPVHSREAYTEHNETIYHCKVVQAAKWTIDHYKSCREKPQKTLLTKPTKMSLT